MSSEKFWQQRKSGIAICFARMYGIKETLEPLEFLENEAVIKIVCQWADEFLDSDARSSDLVQFFEKKSACLRKADPNQALEGEK